MIETGSDQSRAALATLFACTVRAMERNGTISGDYWIAELMSAYNLLRESGEHNLPTMETLSWAMQAFQALRKEG